MVQPTFDEKIIQSSGGSKVGRRGRVPPPTRGSKFFQFHAVFWKFWQNRMLAPPSPGELAPPPRGNPGSATGCSKNLKEQKITQILSHNTFI